MIASTAPSAALAQNVPSYGTPAARQEMVRGTVTGFNGAYVVYVHDDRGYNDNLTMHQGTIIDPTGIRLVEGMRVSAWGYADGPTFDAYQIEVAGGGPYYAGYSGYPYGYGYATAIRTIPRWASASASAGAGAGAVRGVGAAYRPWGWGWGRPWGYWGGYRPWGWGYRAPYGYRGWRLSWPGGLPWTCGYRGGYYGRGTLRGAPAGARGGRPAGGSAAAAVERSTAGTAALTQQRYEGSLP